MFKAPKSIKRSHVIVAKGGKVLDAQYEVKPADSVEAALKFVEAHKIEAANGAAPPVEAPAEAHSAEEPEAAEEAPAAEVSNPSKFKALSLDNAELVASDPKNEMELNFPEISRGISSTIAPLEP